MPSAREIVCGEVQDMVVKQLEQGVVPWRQGWVSLTQQGIKGNEYKGINALITSLVAYKRGFTDPRWITKDNILKRGGRIKSEEFKEHTLVVFWNFKEVEKDGEKKQLCWCTYYKVWNVEQTEGVEFKPIISVKKVDPLLAGEQVFVEFLKRPGAPEFLFNGEDPAYYPKKDAVVFPHREQFKTSERYYSTLFHELAHSTGHQERLKRFDSDTTLAPFGSADYGKEELVAELTTAFVCRFIGVDLSAIESQSAYIQGWVDKIKEDKSIVFSAAQKAQKAFNLIVGDTDLEGTEDES